MAAQFKSGKEPMPKKITSRKHVFVLQTDGSAKMSQALWKLICQQFEMAADTMSTNHILCSTINQDSKGGELAVYNAMENGKNFTIKTK